MWYEDLIQEGCIGLIKAIDNFDLSYENKFSTYAVYYIKTSIVRAIESNNYVCKIPKYVYLLVSKYMYSKLNNESNDKEKIYDEKLELQSMLLDKKKLFQFE